MSVVKNMVIEMIAGWKIIFDWTACGWGTQQYFMQCFDLWCLFYSGILVFINYAAAIGCYLNDAGSWVHSILTLFSLFWQLFFLFRILVSFAHLFATVSQSHNCIDSYLEWEMIPAARPNNTQKFCFNYDDIDRYYTFLGSKWFCLTLFLLPMSLSLVL